MAIVTGPVIGASMAVDIVFETHAISTDNEAGLATGWHPGRLSPRGEAAARELGERRRDDGLTAVFTSDLTRALQTVAIAFADSDVATFHDWRLRECDYGELTRKPTSIVHGRRAEYLDQPYPGGECWREAVSRVARVLDDLSTRWDGQRVLVVGHVATRWALDHHLGGLALEDLAERDFVWQEGWTYRLDG
jgi:2,3-bisphosphoglycerate-dependent phosphoglycerate mutase